MLFEICGTISMDEVIAENPDLEPVKKLLGKSDFDKFRKSKEDELKDISKDIAPIKDIIAEKMRETEDDLPDLEETKDKLKKLQDSQLEFKMKIKGLETDSGVEELRQKALSLLKQIEVLTKAHDEEVERAARRAKAAAETKKQKIKEVSLNIEKVKGAIEWTGNEIARQKKKIEDKLKEWNEVAKSSPEKCSLCGSFLTPERRKMMVAEKLKIINSEGMAIQEIIKDLESKKVSLEEKLESLEAELKKVSEVDAEFEEIPKPKKLDKLEEKYKKTLEEMDKVAEQGSSSLIEKYELEISEIGSQIEELERVLQKWNARNAAEKRIAELKAERKKLIRKRDKLEEDLILASDYNKTRAEMLSRKINDHFDRASFKLFHEQMNGELSEVCEVTLDGVPYADLNTESQINVGLECIDVLSKHFDLYVPVWIDHAESVVVDFYPIESQAILLIATKIERLTIR